MLVRASIVLAAVLSLSGPAFGQLGTLIYSQAPDRLFGYASDSELGDGLSAVRADRFSVAADREIGQVVWFGMYGPQLGPIQTPPVADAFRIRFFNQNGTPPPSVPPGDLLYEMLVLEPSREETGAFISGGFPEYRFVANLPDRFLVSAQVPYWISIVQIGESSSYFRWETAGPGDHARQIPADSPWVVVGTGQLAFQLRVPEPITGGLLALGALAATARRRRVFR